MDNSAENNGNISFFCSIVLSIFTWFNNVNPLDLITGAGALFSAIMCGRYYWYATKQKKKELERDE